MSTLFDPTIVCTNEIPFLIRAEFHKLLTMFLDRLVFLGIYNTIYDLPYKNIQKVVNHPKEFDVKITFFDLSYELRTILSSMDEFPQNSDKKELANKLLTWVKETQYKKEAVFKIKKQLDELLELGYTHKQFRDLEENISDYIFKITNENSF